MNSLLPDQIYQLARQVVDQNKAAGRIVTIAESCTGGLVSAALTEISGSSAVMQIGFVTYANEAKAEALGVDSGIIDKFGAVSTEVAREMAKGALLKSHADIAVAISGIAGPGGGTGKKPVGTVMFAVAEQGSDYTKAERMNFGADLSRAEIRMAATLHALELLLPA